MILHYKKAHLPNKAIHFLVNKEMVNEHQRAEKASFNPLTLKFLKEEKNNNAYIFTTYVFYVYFVIVIMILLPCALT